MQTLFGSSTFSTVSLDVITKMVDIQSTEWRVDRKKNDD